MPALRHHNAPGSPSSTGSGLNGCGVLPTERDGLERRVKSMRAGATGGFDEALRQVVHAITKAGNQAWMAAAAIAQRNSDGRPVRCRRWRGSAAQLGGGGRRGSGALAEACGLRRTLPPLVGALPPGDLRDTKPRKHPPALTLVPSGGYDGMPRGGDGATRAQRERVGVQARRGAPRSEGGHANRRWGQKAGPEEQSVAGPYGGADLGHGTGA
mmetsp:Transcript_60348/g.165782  ORF Transcript_60348/g.165782 Transcript_60348/m.165782 type:complete len:213 (+) Transcript_60348:687-1325(+)